MALLDIFKTRRRDVALVLSSGGARGLAHVGAIHALESRGFHITSVAGTSMGAIVGSMFAAGQLEEYSQWMQTIDKRKMRQLTDFSLSLNHVVKGDRIVEAMKAVVADQDIESLPIPLRIIATDLVSGKEVVFSKGSMYEAMRASFSIPSYFEPVSRQGMLLIDGGMSNPLPLDRVARNGKDLLVAINVSGHDYEGMYRRQKAMREWQIRNIPGLRLVQRVLGPEAMEPEFNYLSMLNRAFSISISQNARKAIRLNKPDILVNIPMRRYGGGDYDKFDRLEEIGRKKTLEAIDKFLAKDPLANITPTKQ